MRKQLVFLLLFIFLHGYLFSQKTTERYCEVSVLTNTRHLRGLIIDSGYVQPNTSINDSLDSKELSEIKDHSSVIELLNFVAKRGWILSFTMIENNPEYRKTYYFKKAL